MPPYTGPFLLCCDVDGTLVQGQRESMSTHKFASYCHVQRELLGTLLVYNTGRERSSLERIMADTRLPIPDVVCFCLFVLFVLMHLVLSEFGRRCAFVLKSVL